MPHPSPSDGLVAWLCRRRIEDDHLRDGAAQMSRSSDGREHHINLEPHKDHGPSQYDRAADQYNTIPEGAREGQDITLKKMTSGQKFPFASSKQEASIDAHRAMPHAAKNV